MNDKDPPAVAISASHFFPAAPPPPVPIGATYGQAMPENYRDTDVQPVHMAVQASIEHVFLDVQHRNPRMAPWSARALAALLIAAADQVEALQRARRP
jgi:hypothetical protein